MATPNTTSKSARIETRVSPEQKELIERAAAVSGAVPADVANIVRDFELQLAVGDR